MSAVSFVSLFIFKPLEQLRKSSISLTWLNIVTTTYWTRHYYLNKTGSLDAELEKATTDTLQHLEDLLQASGKRVSTQDMTDDRSTPDGEAEVAKVPPPAEGQVIEVENPAGTAAKPAPSAVTT